MSNSQLTPGDRKYWAPLPEIVAWDSAQIPEGASVLEDLYDPFHLCDGMSRVAKAGYVEVPSPLSEICRGVDGSATPWRGNYHHRYCVWNKDGALQFLSKYPAVEHVSLSDETAAPRILRRDPMAWNGSLLWQGEIRYRYLQHGLDYNIIRNYRKAIVTAVNEGLAQARALRATLATGWARTTPSPAAAIS